MDTLRIDQNERERLDRSLLAILEAWTGHKIRDCHRAADLVNLIRAYDLPDDYWEGRHGAEVFREKCGGLRRDEETIKAWEAINGPRHPERWLRLGVSPYPRKPSLKFPITLTSTKESGYVVTFPDVPEAVTQADNEEEAMDRGLSALKVALSFYEDDGRSIPVPSPLKSGQRYVEIWE